MSYFEIFIYSVIQGVTEFLPISSSAHLIYLENIFNWPSIGIYFAVAAHFGTLLAVIVNRRLVLFKLIKNILLFIKKDPNYSYKRKNELLCLIVASIPIILIGGIITIFFDNFIFSLIALGIASILGGVFLELSDRFGKKRSRKALSIKTSLFAGVFQCFAIIPGMSRSGACITALRFCGLSRTESAEFSLLMGIPIITIAGIFSILKVISLGENSIILSFFFIFIVSLFTALVSIKWMLKWLKNRSFMIFVVYRTIFGLLLIISYFYI